MVQDKNNLDILTLTYAYVLAENPMVLFREPLGDECGIDFSIV